MHIPLKSAMKESLFKLNKALLKPDVLLLFKGFEQGSVSGSGMAFKKTSGSGLIFSGSGISFTRFVKLPYNR